MDSKQKWLYPHRIKEESRAMEKREEAGRSPKKAGSWWDPEQRTWPQWPKYIPQGPKDRSATQSFQEGEETQECFVGELQVKIRVEKKKFGWESADRSGRKEGRRQVGAWFEEKESEVKKSRQAWGRRCQGGSPAGDWLRKAGGVGGQGMPSVCCPLDVSPFPLWVLFSFSSA